MSNANFTSAPLLIAALVVTAASCGYPRIANPTTSVQCLVNTNPVCAALNVQMYYAENETDVPDTRYHTVYLGSVFDSTQVSIYLNTMLVFDESITSHPAFRYTGVSVSFDEDGNFVVDYYDFEKREWLSSGWYSGQGSVGTVILCIDGCPVSIPVLDQYKMIGIGRHRSKGEISVGYRHMGYGNI